MVPPTVPNQNIHERMPASIATATIGEHGHLKRGKVFNITRGHF